MTKIKFKAHENLPNNEGAVRKVLKVVGAYILTLFGRSEEVIKARVKKEIAEAEGQELENESKRLENLKSEMEIVKELGMDPMEVYKAKKIAEEADQMSEIKQLEGNKSIDELKADIVSKIAAIKSLGGSVSINMENPDGNTVFKSSKELEGYVYTEFEEQEEDADGSIFTQEYTKKLLEQEKAFYEANGIYSLNKSVNSKWGWQSEEEGMDIVDSQNREGFTYLLRDLVNRDSKIAKRLLKRIIQDLVYLYNFPVDIIEKQDAPLLFVKLTHASNFHYFDNEHRAPLKNLHKSLEYLAFQQKNIHYILYPS